MRRGLTVLAFLVSIFTFTFGTAMWGSTAPAKAAVFPGTTAGTRVYTLEPLDFNVVPAMQLVLQGACLNAGSQCQRIPTQSGLDPSHLFGIDGEVGPISNGSASLDAQLKTDPPDTPVLVFGYSQGAQIAGFWLRNRAKNASSYASAANTKFLLIGDPENTYGVPWTPKVPTTTGYQVTELWVQYDGWADWPTRPNPLAIANAIAGQMFVHPTAYLTVDPTSSSNVTWTKGNMTYTLVPNNDLPIVRPLRLLGLNTLADSIQNSIRGQIEAAYDRPDTQAQADAYEATGSRYGTVSNVSSAARLAAASVPVTPQMSASDATGSTPAQSDSSSQGSGTQSSSTQSAASQSMYNSVSQTSQLAASNAASGAAQYNATNAANSATNIGTYSGPSTSSGSSSGASSTGASSTGGSGTASSSAGTTSGSSSSSGSTSSSSSGSSSSSSSSK